MEKSPLLDRDWSISVLQVLAADEITNYSITMMADEKNDYFKTASRHTKIYDIPVYNHKELIVTIYYCKPALTDDDFVL